MHYVLFYCCEVAFTGSTTYNSDFRFASAEKLYQSSFICERVDRQMGDLTHTIRIEKGIVVESTAKGPEAHVFPEHIIGKGIVEAVQYASTFYWFVSASKADETKPGEFILEFHWNGNAVTIDQVLMVLIEKGQVAHVESAPPIADELRSQVVGIRGDEITGFLKTRKARAWDLIEKVSLGSTSIMFYGARPQAPTTPFVPLYASSVLPEYCFGVF